MCRSRSRCRDEGRRDCLWLCNRPTLPGPSSRACRLLCSLPPSPLLASTSAAHASKNSEHFFGRPGVAAVTAKMMCVCVCVCFFHTSLQFRETTRTAKILVPLSLPLTLPPSLSLWQQDLRSFERFHCPAPHSGRLCLTLPPYAPHCANEFVWRPNLVASTAF